MTIRPATAHDVPAVLPMVEKIVALHAEWDVARYAPLENAAEMYRNWLAARATDAKSAFIVAQREEKLVGFLVATVEREIAIYRLGEYAFIHDLWVDPEYRNEGVARQMVMAAIERFAQLGIRQIRLETAAENDIARALFAQCGFRVATVGMLLDLENGAESNLRRS
jgi:ribosomal protein S18 acetylase RimI-like enzyme